MLPALLLFPLLTLLTVGVLAWLGLWLEVCCSLTVLLDPNATGPTGLNTPGGSVSRAVAFLF